VQFTANGMQLRRAARVMGTIAPRKSPHEPFMQIGLYPFPDVLGLSVTSGECTVKIKVVGEGDARMKGAPVLVNAYRFAALVKATSGDTVPIEIADDYVSVGYVATKLELVAFTDAEGHRDIPTFGDEYHAAPEAYELSRGLGRALAVDVAPDDVASYHTYGVRFIAQPDARSMTVAACSRRMVSTYEVPLTEETCAIDTMVGWKAAQALHKLLDGDTEVLSLRVGEIRAEVQSSWFVWSSLLVTGTYAPFEELFEQKIDHSFVVPTEALERACRRLATITDEKYPAGAFKASGDVLEGRAETVGVGRGSSKIACSDFAGKGPVSFIVALPRFLRILGVVTEPELLLRPAGGHLVVEENEAAAFILALMEEM